MCASALQEQWDDVATIVRGGKGRVIVCEGDQQIAAIVPIRELERLQRWDVEREKLFEAIDRMRTAFADVPEKELEAEIQKGIAKVRAAMRREREAKASG
jgi:hypothetical protein